MTWPRPASWGPFPVPARSDRSARTPGPQPPGIRAQLDRRETGPREAAAARRLERAAQALRRPDGAGGPPPRGSSPRGPAPPPFLLPLFPCLFPATAHCVPSRRTLTCHPAPGALGHPPSRSFPSLSLPERETHTLLLPVPPPPLCTRYLWVTLHPPLPFCLPHSRPLSLSLLSALSPFSSQTPPPSSDPDTPEKS